MCLENSARVGCVSAACQRRVGRGSVASATRYGVNRRFGRQEGDRGQQTEGSPALTAVEVEQPRIRTRPDRDGTQPRRRRPHRLLQPLPLAALLLVLLALIGYWSVYSRTTHRTQVIVAAHALPAGRVLRASDLGHSGLAASSQVLASFLPASEQSSARRPRAEGAGRRRRTDPGWCACECARRRRLDDARGPGPARARRRARTRRPRHRPCHLHQHDRPGADARGRAQP